MKYFLLFLTGVLGAALLTGCACNPGYYAPPYKATIVGCVPAFVPTR